MAPELMFRCLIGDGDGGVVMPDVTSLNDILTSEPNRH